MSRQVVFEQLRNATVFYLGIPKEQITEETVIPYSVAIEAVGTHPPYECGDTIGKVLDRLQLTSE